MSKQQNINRCELCRREKAKGSVLIFISSIKRDGSGVSDVSNTSMSHLNNTVFKLNTLSLTNKTYIASEFNSYVVRIAQK